MKKFFQPSSLLLYLLSILVFFFGGASLASALGMVKSQGLAAAAIVVGYGFIAAFIALIAAIMIVHLFKKELVILLVKILAVIFAIIALFLYLRPRKQQAQIPPEAPLIKTIAYQAPAVNRGQNKSSMGIGIAAPNINEQQVIYFYTNPHQKNASTAPVDSLVIKEAKYGPDISYAPPWFAPLHLKLDYGILYIRTISAGRNYVEVQVNEYTGQTAYLDRTQIGMQYWPEFLLNISSVEQINRQDNPVRIKPLSHASSVNGDYEFLRPINIREHWMQVELLNGDFQKTGQGWIQWKKDGQLLITYSLLS